MVTILFAGEGVKSVRTVDAFSKATMRISSKTRQAISDAVAKFDSEAKVYLFGSRTDDSKKGGDIDLLVESGKIDSLAKLKILARIKDVIGEQKIDLLVCSDIQNSEDVFHTLIKGDLQLL